MTTQESEGAGAGNSGGSVDFQTGAPSTQPGSMASFFAHTVSEGDAAESTVGNPVDDDPGQADSSGQEKTPPAGDKKPASNDGGKPGTAPDKKPGGDGSQDTINVLLQKVEALEKALTKPGKEGDDPGRTDGKDDGAGETAEAFEPLSKEELELLWEEDPKAARDYEREVQGKELSALKKQLQDIQGEQAFNQEMQELGRIGQEFDTKQGAGSFQAIQDQLGDPKYLKDLFEKNPEVAHMIRPMIVANDRIGVTRVLLREASNHNRGHQQQQQRVSTPASTGGGIATKAPAKIDSMADAFAASKAEFET